MIFEQVVENIRKLMNLWRLNLSELSEKTGLTVNGLKHMFENGSFKLESLNKISDALGVPLNVLFAKEITFESGIVDDKETVTIKWVPYEDHTEFMNTGRMVNSLSSANHTLIEQQNQKITILQTKIEEFEKELSLKDEKITFLEKQLEFFKHQSETLKFLNEQLVKSVKENT